MGYGYYEEAGRKCGYSVEAYCDHKDCEKVIWRDADARDDDCDVIFLCTEHKMELDDLREADADESLFEDFYDVVMKSDTNFIKEDVWDDEDETISPATTDCSQESL